MKKNFYILIIALFLFSCKAQKKIIQAESKDVFLFNIENQNFSLLNNKYNEIVYKDNDYLIFTQKWNGYGSHYFNKEYSFTQLKDTMVIKCKCGQEANYSFKNLKFQKGNYELDFEYPIAYNESIKKYERKIKYVLGKEIKSSKELQNLIFNKTYISSEKTTQKDEYFKELKFIEIDLKDTVNVKLKRID